MMVPNSRSLRATLWIGLWVVSVLGAEAAQAAPPPGDGAKAQAAVPAGVPPAGGAKADAGFGAANIFLAPDRNSLLLLSRARQLNQEGRYAEAIRCVGTILEGPEDCFVPSEKGDKVVSGLKAEARALLSRMPRQGRESYELQFGARARQMLTQAVEARDAAGLAEVSRRFFHTQAGWEATLLLAVDTLDRDSPRAAALLLQRLQENSALAEPLEPGLSVLMAACLLRSEEPQTARATLESAAQRFPQGKVRVGGTEVALSAAAAALLGSAQAVAAPSRPLASWPMVRGNAERSASAVGGGPLLSLWWRVPTTEFPQLESRLAEIQDSFRDQERRPLPAGHPLVVNNTVLMRTARNLMAVEFTTGKRRWEVPCDDPFEPLLDPPQDPATGMQPPTDVDTSLRYRIWADATFGTLSSDGQRVFAVEDLSLDVGSRGSRQPFFVNRRTSPADPRPFNRLAAYDVRTGKLVWHVGGSPEELGLALGGTFFLGPPLPLGGHLYVLGEEKGEIRLAVLDAPSGRLVWVQRLASVETEGDILQDPLRRLAGVSPSCADGVLVCPTSNKSIVALELASRSLLWGYDYSARDASQARQPGAMFGMGLREDVEPGAHWAPSNLVIAQGRVLATPVDSNDLHCLSLPDGKVLWTRPRQDDVYLACVHRGTVMLVGRRSVRGLRLADGSAAWPKPVVELPGGASVSGTGFFNGQWYFVPLDSGEVASIDPVSGRIVYQHKSRRGFVPGNLVCHGGRILSQRAESVDAFYQLEALRGEVDRRLAAQPDDPEALAQRGEILWDEGKLSEAVTCFRRSLQRSPGPNARALLRDALLEGLRTEFAAYRGHAEEIERLLDNARQQASYRRLMAAGCEKAGEYPRALDEYVKLIDLDGRQRGLESLERWHEVRRDRWVREQLASLRQSVPPAVQADLDQLARSRLETALSLTGTEALSRYLDYFGGLPPADRAREALATRLREGGKLLQAEFLLRRAERSAERGQAGAAVAGLASLLREAKLAEDASVCYARLGREFADAACGSGKTGRQWLEALRPDDPVARLLRPAAPWPGVSVVMKREPQRSVVPTPYGSTVIQYLGDSAPFYSEMSLEVQYSPPLLTARDGWGKTRWQLNVGELMRQGIPPMNSAFWRATVRDHLLLVMLGSRLLAIDTLVPEGGSPRLLWSLDTEEPGRSAPMRRSRRFVPVGINPAMRRAMPYQDMNHFPANVPSAVTEQLICFQRSQKLFGLDPLSGEVLWTREDVRPDSALFGDDQQIFVLPPAGSPAMVLRPSDGMRLGTRPVPAERLAPVGRHVLVWRNAGASMVLELRDLWNDRPVWPGEARKFALDARVAAFDGRLVGVYEPRGRFALLGADDGRTIVDATLRPERTVAEMYLHRSPDGYMLVLNGLERNRPAQNQLYGLYGVVTRVITKAHVYGFDLAGKKRWPEPATVEDQFLLVNQPPRLPMLMFACGIPGGRGLASGQPKLAVLGVDKRTGQVFRPEQTFEGSGYLRLLGDPEKKAIQLHLPRDLVTLTFSDKPPPKPSLSRAIFKAMGGGIESLDLAPALEDAMERQILGDIPLPAKPAPPAPQPSKKPAPPEKPAGQPGKQPAQPNKEPQGAKP